MWAKTVRWDAIFRLELNFHVLPLERQIPGCFCLGETDVFHERHENSGTNSLYTLPETTSNVAPEN